VVVIAAAPTRADFFWGIDAAAALAVRVVAAAATAADDDVVLFCFKFLAASTARADLFGMLDGTMNLDLHHSTLLFSASKKIPQLGDVRVNPDP
jgi:hypothetical protein